MKRVPLKKLDLEPSDVLDEDLKFLTVNVNENWRMQYDGVQFQMQERKVRAQEGKNQGEVWWKRHAYISDLDNAIVWLSRKRVYLSPGVFDGRALIEICRTLDGIKGECKAAFAEMRTLMLAKAQVEEPLTEATAKALWATKMPTPPVKQEPDPITKPPKRVSRGKGKNS